MKQLKASVDSNLTDLHRVNLYLEQNFPDFFAEARFHVGDDDYFLYSRFGQYLARSIENNRAPRQKIYRGFTVLNKMARMSARNPTVRHMLVSGPLEYIADGPRPAHWRASACRRGSRLSRELQSSAAVPRRGAA
jgi:hypothetical protein